MQFQEFHHFVSHILKSNFKIKCQDTVVLGKNGRHSFERMQDRIPASTRSNYRTNWKRIIGTPARERQARAGAFGKNWTNQLGLNLKLVRCE